MNLLIALAALVAGSLNAIQAGINSTLGKGLNQPVLAAIIVSLVGSIAYLLSSIVFGIGLPASGKAAALPWWAWIGGLLGAAYVLSTVFLAERLGSALFTGLTVTAAVVTSVILDHYGLVGFKEHPAGLWRAVGCILMIGGLALLSLF